MSVIRCCHHRHYYFNACALSLQDLLKTTLDFHALEKLEFSGIRGNALSQQVQQVDHEFQEMYRVFSESSYDCLDPQSMVGLERPTHNFCLFLSCLQPVRSGVTCIFPSPLALWSQWYYEGSPTGNYSLCQEEGQRGLFQLLIAPD